MRIQLDIPAAMELRIKPWMNEVGFKTYSELFNNAMTLMWWVRNEIKSGRIIVSVDPDRKGYEKQLSMPFMDAIAPKAHKDTLADKLVAHAHSG